MATQEAGGRSLGVECIDALNALSRLLARLEGERQLSDSTREAAAFAAEAAGRASRLAATVGEEFDWRRRMEGRMAETRDAARDLERRVGELYRAMHEQTEWPAG
ncbi:MAG: hypothetical protein PVH00_08900 [Gemmatimonadota bacterium]|jgi:hypothetical protein